MADKSTQDQSTEPDLAKEGPLAAVPDATDLSARADLQAAGGPARDEPYAPEKNVFDPADDVGLATGQGTES